MVRSSAFLIASCFLALASSLQADDLYGFDVPKRYPKAYAAYSAVLPGQYKKIAWVRKLDGTSVPVTNIEAEGAPSLLFWMCEPHNCGGNELTALLAKDGSKAVALFQSRDHTDGKKIYFGNPDAAERALLTNTMEK
jgi:hypothetical protein